MTEEEIKALEAEAREESNRRNDYGYSDIGDNHPCGPLMG